MRSVTTISGASDKLALKTFYRLDAWDGSGMVPWIRPTNGTVRYIRFAKDNGVLLQAIHRWKRADRLKS
ncbi:hypothetical protein D2T81_21760 [Azospirillum brasilense]|nr:hypothetical protein D2T81_21760 [Azospirillum brasilense]